MGSGVLKIPADFLLNANGLHGSSGQIKGMEFATEYAEKTGDVLRVARAKVIVRQGIPGGIRVGCDKIKDIGFCNFSASGLIKSDLQFRFEEIVMAAATKNFGGNVESIRSAKSVLATHPVLARAIFAEYPNLDIVVIDGCVSYSGAETVRVAVINKISCIKEISVLYRPDVRVKIV